MSRRSALVALVAAVAVVLLIVLFATAPTDPDRQGADPLDDRPAPAINATDTAGRPFHIDDYRGHWLVVNFFATWCTPCKIEHPELVAFSRAHSTKGDAAVVSIAYDDEAPAIADFFKKNGGDWPVISKNTAGISLAYGVVKLPESFLVDTCGTVVHKFVGGVTAAGIDAEIAKRGGGSK